MRHRNSRRRTREASIVTYTIVEGPQKRVGEYKIDGVTPAQLAAIKPRLALQSGQPYSGNNLAQDRDTVLGYFLDNGYDHATVTLRQDPFAEGSRT